MHCVPHMHPTPPPRTYAAARQVLLMDEITVDMDVLGRIDLLNFFEKVSARGLGPAGERCIWGGRSGGARQCPHTLNTRHRARALWNLSPSHSAILTGVR